MDEGGERKVRIEYLKKVSAPSKEARIDLFQLWILHSRLNLHMKLNKFQFLIKQIQDGRESVERLHGCGVLEEEETKDIVHSSCIGDT